MTSTAETIRTVIAEMRDFYEAAVTVDDDQFLSWIDRLEPLVAAAARIPAEPAPAIDLEQFRDSLDLAAACIQHSNVLGVRNASKEIRRLLDLIDGQGKTSSSISPKELFDRWYGSCDARFLNNWDACYSAFLAGRQSAQPAAGEEIMVNAAHDVYILPLQPSGLLSGPRFVVHVPGPEQPTPPSAPVGVRCGECRGTGEVCTGTIDGTPELFDCGRCGGTGNSLAQQPAAVDGAAAIRAFEEHFEASAEDPYFESELELWLTAWRKAIAAQQQGGRGDG